MKRLIACSALALFLCSCAGVNVKQPEIGNVKKVAILSVTANEEYKDIESTKEDKASVLNIVGNVIKDAVEMFTEEQVAVVTHGAEALSQALNGIEGWKVIPAEEVANNEAVNEMFQPNGKAEEVLSTLNRLVNVRYVTPKGMHELHYADVHPEGAHWVNGERVEAPLLRAIGKLCESLGVDAIAVAEYAFYYETGMLTSVTSNVTPIVFMNVALIDKNGEKILYTDRGWAKVEGDESAKFNHGYVDLRREQSVPAYNGAIDKIADEFRKQAAKKLGK